MRKNILALFTVMVSMETFADKELKPFMDFTAYFEGFSSVPYKDAHGHSIGYGHFLNLAKVPNISISKDEALVLLQIDMGKAIRISRKLFLNFDSLPVEVQKICVDLAFNLGENRLRKFKKMIEACNLSDFAKMADELESSKWTKQVGRRSRNHISMLRRISREDKTIAF